MSIHNVCFYGEITKIVPKLSSDTLLICFTAAALVELVLFTEPCEEK